jgi:WD40 repeat protein/serine/threonine protein kinase
MSWLDKIRTKLGGGAGPGGQVEGERSERAGTGTVLREPTDLGSPAIAPQAIRAAEEQVASEWRVGDVILDLYEVKQIHEGGGMGLVYRVHHRGWNIDLAVKSPRRDYFQTETQKENFTRECETWINLGLHPHVVSCHYVRTLGGIPRVFAEYLEGGSLSDWIASKRLYEGGPESTLKRILDIAIQTAWGLHCAHEQGLIHQDVKPANILMMPDGTAKVTDFGLAKARAVTGESFVAGAGRSILVSTGGMTPAYCSPEQANGEPLLRKTDIWSWAVSVLEMLVGEVRWQSGTAAPEVLRHLGEERVEGIGIPGPPPELVKLLEQCFSTEPDGRPEDFRVVADGLKGIYAALGGEDYIREFPEVAELQADALNNRAVSMLDLGRAAEAEKLFGKALTVEAFHPQATYNLGLHLWRHGRVTDDRLVEALEQSRRNRPDDWNPHYLLGRIHLERRDAERAVAALLTAQTQTESDEIKGALEEARSIKSSVLKLPADLEGREKVGGKVVSVALSADGRWALSGGYDYAVRLWDLPRGKCVRIFEGHRDNVQAVALSADGRWAMSGSWDRTLRLWEASSGKCLRTFKHPDMVWSVVFSASGLWVLSGCDDGKLRMWDVKNGECLRSFEGHNCRVYSVALNADENRALSGGADGIIALWEVKSGKYLKIFKGHTGRVTSVVLSADGHQALSGSWDKTVRLWDVTSGECLRVFAGHTDSVESVARSADGRLAASSGETVRLWEVSSGKCLRTDWHAGGLAFSVDGRWTVGGAGDSLLVVAVSEFSSDGQTRRSPLALCRPIGTTEALSTQNRFRHLIAEAERALKEGDSSRAWIAASESRRLIGHQFSKQAMEMAHQAGLHGRRIALRAAHDWRILKGHTGQINSISLNSDGHWCLSGSSDFTLRLWDMKNGKCARTFQRPWEESINNSRVTLADGREVKPELPRGGILAAEKWVLYRITLPDGREYFHHEPMRTFEVCSVALSAGGRLALSGGTDHKLRLWELSSGKCLRVFEGHTDSVHSVTLSADSRLALSGGWDKTLRLWELKSGRCLRILEGHTGGVMSVALSADCRLGLSGSADKTLRLWEICSGRCLRIFEGHVHHVPSSALSVDGRLALSGSYDKTLRLWDVSSGKCLRVLEGHTGWINSVALTTDARWAVSGGEDGKVLLWDLSSGKCLRNLHTKSPAHSVALSRDGRWASAAAYESNAYLLRAWELECDYEFPETENWDEGARPLLVNFLMRHTPYASTDPNHPECLLRRGHPTWKDGDWLNLLQTLQYAGYGWLRPDGVARELERMAAEWQRPPPLPWGSGS